jgi:hypothetical protein
MVLAEFQLCSCNGYRDQGDDAYRSQREVDISEGEQSALRDYIQERKRLAHIPPAIHGNGLAGHVVVQGKHDGNSGNILD